MAILNANVLATATTTYTSTGNTVISTLHLCNQSGSSVGVDVHLVPNGSSAAATNIIYKNLTIAAGDTYITTADERFLLGNGDFISVVANTANAVISTVTYIGT